MGAPAPSPEELIPSLSWLEQSVDSSGLVRHGGVGYLFDMILVLAAFTQAYERGIRGGFVPLIDQIERRARAMFEAGQAAEGPAEARWSTVFGPHVLKSAALLALARQAVPLPRFLKSAVASLLLLQGRKGEFGNGNPGKTYLHAHCYALEGLSMLRAMGVEGLDDALGRGLEFLAGCELPGGGFGQWSGDDRGAASTGIEVAADVTAQAGRLFLLSSGSYIPWRVGGIEGERLERIDSALARLVGPGGGLRYLTSSAHENTWCTAFALQYLAARHGAALRAEQLV